ncbi:hypothetical protein K2173_007045 [Erythroxylum novogranatense]|uniref:Uncharacterized protein n=1 Tax=Erythroxylum novogranatense TaxID=1862640 RepID=A0AAV8SL09_9ROSI|nr:hypothetical protein K2173_007045 [Erythroxylum novogranatense]
MDKTQSQSGHLDNKKRARDDSCSDSLESKIPRVCSQDSLVNSPEPVEIPVHSDGSVLISVDSSDNKRIQNDLLSLVDISDDFAIQGLESVIKSFEDEIIFPNPLPEIAPPSAEVSSLSDESQTDIIFLFEASDDELGLPPSFSSGDEGKIGADDPSVMSLSGTEFLSEMLRFEDVTPNFDSFEFEFGCESDSNSYDRSHNDDDDFVALGGLFDHSDSGQVALEMLVLRPQPGSLPLL